MVNLVKQNYYKNKVFYNKIKRKIKNEIGDEFSIDHVGSTAIPNMYGKNILDILIGVKNNDELEQITNSLVKLGFFKSKHNREEIYRFFASTEEESGSGDIHIHLVITETDRYKEFLILKKYLLINETEAQDYSKLKKQLIKDGITERGDYKSTKSKYVTDLLKRAKEYYNK